MHPQKAFADSPVRLAGHVRFLMAAALVAFTFGPYLISGFLLDDYFHLERLLQADGPQLSTFAIDSEAHHLYLWPLPDGVRFVFFRPIVILTLWLDWRLWGLHAAGFHFTNVALHAVNMWLLYCVALRLHFTRRGAWLAAVAWGVSLHAAPAVGWISGRTEILVAMFVLLSMLTFLRWRECGNGWWFAATLALIGLACGAKESGVVAPLLILLIERQALRGRTTAIAMRPLHVVALLLPSLIYVSLRLWLVQTPLPPPPYFQLPTSPADAALLGVNLLVYVLSALLSLPLVPLAPADWLIARPVLLLPLLALAAGLILALLRWGTRESGLVFMAWFIVALGPYAGVMATSLYLYLPLMGVMLLLAFASQRAGRRLPWIWTGCMIAIGLVGNGSVALFVRRVTSSVGDSVGAVVNALEAQSASHLVLIDAPLWTYALPAAVRVRFPDRAFDTHFLNFAPGILPREPSGVRQLDRRSLELLPADGAYFDSGVERFMLFGAQPASVQVRVREPLSRVLVEGDSSRPSRLVFEFRSAEDLAAAAVVQFDGWRPQRITTSP